MESVKRMINVKNLMRITSEMSYNRDKKLFLIHQPDNPLMVERVFTPEFLKEIIKKVENEEDD